MGAQVLGCGHASQLFKVEYLEGAPQVHIHFLTSDDEFASDRTGRMEFVCHGCGASLLLLYDDATSRRRYLSIRNRFKVPHMHCRDRGFEKSCPDYRSSFAVMDVRRGTQQAAKQAGAA